MPRDRGALIIAAPASSAGSITPTLQGLRITGGDATGLGGGGLYLRYGEATLINNVVTDGSGVHVTDDGD